MSTIVDSYKMYCSFCSKAGEMKQKELDRPCNAEPHVTHQDKEAHVIL